MTGMLASVSNLAEAKLVLAENVDIIDLKDPSLGSLGAVDIAQVKKIVGVVSGQCPVSATIGDLPMEPELIFDVAKAMAETGVNYIKIGLFPDQKTEQVIEKLTEISKKSELIAVLFADIQANFNIIEQLKFAGFRGVMLDTFAKKQGSLTNIMAKTDIEYFVNNVKSRQLLCGLAGSLTIRDIPQLKTYQPDYLGFRGALCDLHDRVGQINKSSVREIKQALTELYR